MALLSLNVSAKNINTKDISVEKPDALEDLKSRLDKIQTLSGRFQQTIKDNKGEIVQDPTFGEFSLKRPGYFLWESKEPYPQLVIGTPDTLKVYDPDLEQLTTYPKKPDDQNNPAQLLSGDLSSMRSAFIVKKVDSKKDVSTYYLTPIKSDTSYKEIRFVLQADEIMELICLDKLEQTTTIVFIHQNKNYAMKDDIFNFIPPEGTEIIINE